jgi:hypothetical protein
MYLFTLIKSNNNKSLPTIQYDKLDYQPVGQNKNILSVDTGSIYYDNKKVNINNSKTIIGIKKTDLDLLQNSFNTKNKEYDDMLLKEYNDIMKELDNKQKIFVDRDNRLYDEIYNEKYNEMINNISKGTKVNGLINKLPDLTQTITEMNGLISTYNNAQQYNNAKPVADAKLVTDAKQNIDNKLKTIKDANDVANKIYDNLNNDKINLKHLALKKKNYANIVNTYANFLNANNELSNSQDNLKIAIRNKEAADDYLGKVSYSNYKTEMETEYEKTIKLQTDALSLAEQNFKDALSKADQANNLFSKLYYNLNKKSLDQIRIEAEKLLKKTKNDHENALQNLNAANDNKSNADTDLLKAKISASNADTEFMIKIQEKQNAYYNYIININLSIKNILDIKKKESISSKTNLDNIKKELILIENNFNNLKDKSVEIFKKSMELTNSKEWETYFSNYNYEPQCFYLKDVINKTIKISINGMETPATEINLNKDTFKMIIDSFQLNKIK